MQARITINNITYIQDMNQQEEKSISQGFNDEEQALLKIAAGISPRTVSHTKHLLSLVSSCEAGTLHNGMINVKELFPWEYELKTHSPSPICSKRIHQASVRTAFSCFDCRQCDNSILCYECFSHSSHDGHRYIQFQTTGGCCDCGDIDAWNELGFCDKHGKASECKDIDPAVMEMFGKEMGYAYGLYFWLIRQCKTSHKLERVRFIYGTVLIGHSANLVSEQYQLKYLLNRVLQQPVEVWGQAPKSNLSVIEQFFRMEQVDELAQFNKICIQLFPVEEFRFAYIKEYFQKTWRNEMSLEHPLKELNYQYMGRAKVISMLIEQGQLRPLLLQPFASSSTAQLPSLFRKYVDDFTYLIKPKSAILYFRLHFQRINICQMFFYRKETDIQQSQHWLLLDDYMLKIYAEMLKIIKGEKVILEKIMLELIEYVLNLKENTYSLVHERAFAMTAITYLQGDMHKLMEGAMRAKFMQIMGQNNQQGLNTTICEQVRRHMERMVLAEYFLIDSNDDNDEYSSNFMSNYPQRYLLESLDRVYIKILIKLHQGPFPLEDIVYRSTTDVDIRLVVGVLEIVNSILAMELDEVIVCDQVQVDCREKCFNFLKRFLKSYPAVSAKDLKYLAKFIINNDQLIDEFLANEVKVEKGKIVTSFPQQPLEIFIYRKSFEAMRIEIFKAVPAYFHKIPRTKDYLDSVIYNEATVNNILQQFSDRLKTLSQLVDSEELFPGQVESFILILAEIYAETHYQGCKELFATIMSMDIKKYARKEALDQANHTMNPQDSTSDSPLKLKELEDGAKKKEALLKKRKEKEEAMKRKQQELLKNYDKLQEHSTLESCIYCKQNNNTQLYFVAYCNFTGIYQKKCLKAEGHHLFMQTCGHKIHHDCYQKYLNQVAELNLCFLCKRHVNILVPYFHEGTPVEIKRKLGEEFASIIYPILLLKYEDREEMVNKFFGETHAVGALSALLESFVRQTIMRAVYDVGSFQKDFLPIYMTVYEIIAAESEQSQPILEEMARRVASLDTQSQFKQCELIMIQILQQHLFKKETQAKANHFKQCQKVKTLFHQVLTLFSNKHISNIEFAEVQLAQKYPLVSEIPQKLIDLLPAKPQCGVCHKLSNRLLACLLCPWVGCDDDKDCMKQHCQKQHIDGSIFVFLYNGQIIYVFESLLYVTESIYYNFLGQSMSREKRQISKEQLQKYSLDRDEFAALKKTPIQHTIHQFASK